MFVNNQECFQSAQHLSGPLQDGGYYSRKDYGWLLIGLLIFNFSSNLTGPDMKEFLVFGILYNLRGNHQESSKSKNAPIPPNICQDLIKMVNITLRWIMDCI